MWLGISVFFVYYWECSFESVNTRRISKFSDWMLVCEYILLDFGGGNPGEEDPDVVSVADPTPHGRPAVFVPLTTV